jgi:hypothetical protein
VSRNTVRAYARSVEVLSAEALAEEILQGSPPSSTIETDPLSTPGSAAVPNQTDPLSTAGNTGRKSLCADHAAFILAKCEAGLSAQRIYQDLRVEIAFTGSYQDGGAEGSRTPDLLIANETLYQLSYDPDIGAPAERSCSVGADRSCKQNQ